LGAVTSSLAEDKPEFRVIPSRKAYMPSDTVIIAVEVHIPPDFYLCGNPLGPGTGRAMEIVVACSDTLINWCEVKKIKAEKYGPPFGEWIWAYRDTTTVFCTGRVSPSAAVGHELKGVLLFRGLFCHTTCRLMEKKLPFSIKVGAETQVDHFTDDTTLSRQYVQASRMSDLPVEESVGDPVSRPPCALPLRFQDR
jgi:hypothetical protein